LDALKEPALAYAELISTLPGRVNSLLRRMETNQFELRVHAVNVDGAQKEERRGMQRSFTFVLSALIVGAGLTMAQNPQAFGSFLFFGAIFALMWGFVMLYYSE
jgi:hypothetical protein